VALFNPVLIDMLVAFGNLCLNKAAVFVEIIILDLRSRLSPEKTEVLEI